MKKNREKILKGAELIVSGLGVDADNENFKDTPRRIRDTLLYYFRGITEKKNIIKELRVDFPSSYKNIVVLKELTGMSLCPHHFLPILYTANFAYIPKKKVTGASKPYKLFKVLAAQPIMQEDLTQEFIDVFWNNVHPLGCIINVRGKFLCHDKEGISHTSSEMITVQSRGCFDKLEYKNQFFELIK